jgi:hypothetical protein
MSRRYCVDEGAPHRGDVCCAAITVLGFREGVWPRTVMTMFLLLLHPAARAQIPVALVPVGMAAVVEAGVVVVGAEGTITFAVVE